MFTSEIKTTYVQHWGTDLTAVNSARISMGSSSQELNEKDIKLIKYLARERHLSPFEHMGMTVIMECPLYVRSQIHRHRTLNFNEVSRRYTAEDIKFYIPPNTDLRRQAKSNKQASAEPFSEDGASCINAAMKDICMQAAELYVWMLDEGVSREQARGILPQCLMTKFYATANLRSWTHFIKLRDHAHAQKEVQYVAQQTKALLLEHFPISSAALLDNYST